MAFPLSVIIITKNEESNIKRCLSSIFDGEFAGEVIVVDSGSQDLTCAIAQEMGARVLKHDWIGYGPQKKWATEQAKHDWILSIDADEVVSQDLAQEIKQKFMELDPKAGYEMARKSSFMEAWILHGGWYPDRQLRLFNRQHSQWPDSKIHERVVVSGGKIERLNSDLLHYVFKNLSHQVDTNNRYSSLLAQSDFEKGKRFSYFRFLTKPTVKFLECYFLKLGFLDGFPGFVIAKNAGYSIFLRQIKLKEIEKRSRNV